MRGNIIAVTNVVRSNSGQIREVQKFCFKRWSSATEVRNVKMCEKNDVVVLSVIQSAERR